MASTTWTDEEYACVAAALLWPSSRQSVLVMGMFPAGALPFQLGGRLSALAETEKASALSLARQIEAAERELYAMASGCSQKLSVTRVGDIELDVRAGLAQRRQIIAEMRGRLALAVNFIVNPNAQNAPAGGISGTWSP